LPGHTSVRGMNPSGRGKATFYIETSVMDEYADAGFASKFFDLYCVPEVLVYPTVVFQGLTREDQAQSLCYAAIPSKRYLDADTTVPPIPDRTFAVYMNKELKIFDWRWEKSDPEKDGYPEKWQTRYEKIVWQALKNI